MRNTLAVIAVVAALSPSAAQAQQQPEPLNGLFYYAVENLQAGRIEQRGTAGASGVSFSNLRLAPNTRYRIWLLQASTLHVGRATLTTPANGRQFQIPPIAMREAASFDDDGDQLSLQAERILGTDPKNPDSDGDGVQDGPEVQQGTNPLDGLPARTGIVATVDTPGNALDVCASDDYVVVADGPSGISVFNVFNQLTPQVIARVEIPGEARKVSCEGNLIAVAGSEELSIVDLSDPPAARVSQRVSRFVLGGEPTALAVADRVVYVVVSTEALTVDLETGGVIDRFSLQDRGVDVALERDAVFFRTFSGLEPLRIRPVAPTFTPRISLPGVGPIGRIFVGGGFAYAARLSSLSVADCRDLDAPTVGPATFTGAGMRQFVANGSGLGLAVTSPTSGTPRSLSLYDVGDPSQTGTFVTEFATPGDARAVSIYNGLAYVADGERGLQVVNYLAYDTAGVAPVITLTTSFGGDQAEEGQRFWISAECQDDVQVRNVEFWIDGNKVRTDGNFPFEYQFTAPSLSQQSSFTIRARVSDTGGNRTWTPLTTINLVQDATPPSVLRTTPGDGSVLGNNAVVAARLSEPINASTLTAQTFALLGAGPDRTFGTGDDVQVATSISFDATNLTAFSRPLSVPLAPGLYRATLSTGVEDRRGLALAQPVEWTFTVYDPSADQDSDGVPDELEAFLGLDPNDPDSDGDGTPDGLEDHDSDGLSNLGEVLLSLIHI